jgi:hypothetical protein
MSPFAPFSSALDLETALIAAGASPSCTCPAAIFYADVATSSPMQVNMNTNGSERSGRPTE